MAIIFTKHALTRLDERLFPRFMVEKTIQKPDGVKSGKTSGTLEYHKKFDTQTITAIVNKTDTGEDLVLSCWVDPPMYGTKDSQKRQRYRAYQKASLWEKIKMDILSAFGL